MSYYGYPEYVPVARRRAKAEKKLQQLRKKHPNLKPVLIAGRSLATTWWGKSWNQNLERYADYSNRIGRGRSYVRHRAVLDLQLKNGRVTAMVQGSRARPYNVDIRVDKLSEANWKTIREACAGSFDSIGVLLGGKFPQSLKDLFFHKGSGLFPAPREIHFDCSCPDWASMCKHVAAALYGIGARLDDDPSLFFTLRSIDIDQVITQTVTETAQTLLSKAQQQSRKVLDDIDVGDVFGIELDNLDAPPPALSSVAPQRRAASNNSATRPSPVRASRRRAPATATAILPKGTMLDAILKAVGNGRRGKSVEQLQAKLGWSKTQIRNAISRAGAKGMLETVRPGLYRRTV